MKDRISIKEKKIVFNNVARPVLSKFRPIYRIALIVMILYKASRKNTASLIKLAFLDCVLRSEEKMNEVCELLKNNDCKFNPSFHINPEQSFERAIYMALSEGFIEEYKFRYRLTESGMKLGDEIFADKEIFIIEKSYLNEIKTKVSEEKIENFYK